MQKEKWKERRNKNGKKKRDNTEQNVEIEMINFYKP